MSPKPPLRLRWYEHLLLCWLVRSPRISRIAVVTQAPPDPAQRLEALYRAPSAARTPKT